jgi:hypothetical protein
MQRTSRYSFDTSLPEFPHTSPKPEYVVVTRSLQPKTIVYCLQSGRGLLCVCRSMFRIKDSYVNSRTLLHRTRVLLITFACMYGVQVLSGVPRFTDILAQAISRLVLHRCLARLRSFAYFFTVALSLTIPASKTTTRQDVAACSAYNKIRNSFAKLYPIFIAT